MKNRTFEIRVALLGNVSAGKTTVMNALFRNKFGETSMKRCTAGISNFRVHVPQTDDANSDEAKSSKSILNEIVEDNIKLREGDEVKEKTFDIIIEQEIFPMHAHTKLVVVDIPGINEANAENRYKEYVSEKFETFDCVVVVMDAKQGVNTEDQVFLLNLVKENMKKKDVPVIILCNKVDDPDDEEQLELVKEARHEVEKIFGVTCREEALKAALNKNDNIVPGQNALSPAFIPISAVHAFIHQSGSLMTREMFSSFDKDLIDKIGKDQIGRRKWNKLSKEEKSDAVFDIIKESHEEGLEDSNFDKFLSILDRLLGGDETQYQLIKKQIEIDIANISEPPFQSGKISSSVRRAFETSKLLSSSSTKVAGIDKPAIDVGSLSEAFWEAYKIQENDAFEKFKETHFAQRPCIFG